MKGLEWREELKGGRRGMIKFLLGMIAGVSAMILVEGVNLLAYSERGYHAIGGEWLLVLIGASGLFACGYKLRDWQARESKRRVSRLKSQINDFMYKPKTVEEIEEILKREG